jgi:hypothetical protein
MTSYTPESYYGLIPGSYREHGGPRFGLVPWPTHLRPRESADVELTKKGERYCAANVPLPDIDLKELFGEGQPPILASAGGVFFLTLTRDRESIAYTIERLINMLDVMEDDPDLEEDADREEGADAEFTLGWSEADSLIGHLTGGGYGSRDGEMEPDLGWTEEVDQVRRLETAGGWHWEDGEPDLGFVGIGSGWRTGETTDDREGGDERELDLAEVADGPAMFDGGGYANARQMLVKIGPRFRKPESKIIGERCHVLADGTIFRTAVME